MSVRSSKIADIDINYERQQEVKKLGMFEDMFEIDYEERCKNLENKILNLNEKIEILEEDKNRLTHVKVDQFGDILRLSEKVTEYETDAKNFALRLHDAKMIIEQYRNTFGQEDFDEFSMEDL